MPRHTYAVGAISLFVQLVLDAACSFRSSSAVMRLMATLWPALARTPVANTGQWWLLRLGLFELTRPKQFADDWCFILDHTIQIGKVKCLLIVGIRLSVFEQLERPLEHRDLQVMALEPVEKSDGNVVCQQLIATCEKTRIIPRMLLSDEGTDLLSGYRGFSPLHPEMAICGDMIHLSAKYLKHELEADGRWASFTAAAGSAKQRLAQTTLAHLLPPTPRSKARYMNLQELVTWGERALQYLNNPRPLEGLTLDRMTLTAKLGWLTDYRDALVDWNAAMGVVNATCHYVRMEGYHTTAATELEQQLAPLQMTPMSKRLAQQLIDTVRKQSTQARGGERLVGSSECLESLIGKGKRLEGQQSQSGFTKLILGLAAAVVVPTRDFIQQALDTVKTIDVQNWCRDHLGTSVQAFRRQALGVSEQK